MSRFPAAKKNDLVIGVDVHVPSVGSPAASFPFNGPLKQGLSSNVRIESKPAVVQGSIAKNKTGHVSLGAPTSNSGEVQATSQSVKINGKAAVRSGDPVKTCNDPAPAPTSVVVASSTVMIGI